MGTQTWPTALIPQTFSPAIRKAGLQFRSPFNGTAQVVDFVAERWVFSLTLPPKRKTNAGQVEALLFQLAGGVERVRCWHFFRPQPIGTMRGTVTIWTQGNRGDSTVALTGTSGQTVKAGDMFSAASQLFMAAADATFDGSNHATVTTVNRVRATLTAGAAVTWDAPTADFIMPSMSAAAAYRPAILEGAAFDLEEIW